VTAQSINIKMVLKRAIVLAQQIIMYLHL